MKTINFVPYARRLAHDYMYNHALHAFTLDTVPDYDLLQWDAIRDIRKFAIKAEMNHGIRLDITEDVEDAIYTGIEEGWVSYTDTATVAFKLFSEEKVRNHLRGGYGLKRIDDCAYILSRGYVRRTLVLPVTTAILAYTVSQIDIMNDIIGVAK